MWSLRAEVGQCEVRDRWTGRQCERDGNVGKDGTRLCRAHRQAVARGADTSNLMSLDHRGPCEYAECTHERISVPREVDGEEMFLCEAHGAQTRTIGCLQPLRGRGRRACQGPDCLNAGRRYVEVDGRRVFVCSGHEYQFELGKGLSPLRRLRTRGSHKVRDELGRAHCALCGKWLPESAFFPSQIGKGCRTCVTARSRWYQYNITPEQQRDMYRGQGGKCGICKESATFEELVIDHKHSCCEGDKSCGECVRSLAHARCNTGFGLLQENFRKIVNAACYADFLEVDLVWAVETLRSAHAARGSFQRVSETG